MEFKYWKTGSKEIKSLELSIESAKYYLEENACENDDSNSAIVELYVNDGAGRYAMREFTCRATDQTEEEYNEEFKLNEKYCDNEDEIYAFDKLLEDVNIEFKEYLKEMGLEQNGYNFYVGWNDGNVCLMMYKIF